MFRSHSRSLVGFEFSLQRSQILYQHGLLELCFVSHSVLLSFIDLFSMTHQLAIRPFNSYVIKPRHIFFMFIFNFDFSQACIDIMCIVCLRPKFSGNFQLALCHGKRLSNDIVEVTLYMSWIYQNFRFIQSCFYTGGCESRVDFPCTVFTQLRFSYRLIRSLLSR